MMETGAAAIAIWFCLSVSFAVAANLALHIALWKRKYVRLLDVFAGTPGYLDRIYIKWCNDNHRSYKTLIAVRVLLLLNLILAVVAFAFSIRST